MSDVQHDYGYGDGAGLAAGTETGEVPVNPYSLLEAVNDASEIAHTTWLIFLAVTAYVMVAVAGVSHADLLMNSAVELPVLQVRIELTRFFLFVPIIVALMHFGLLMQHVMLARKVLEFHAALRPLEPTSRRSHPLRLELHSYFFTQTLAGPERSPLFGIFLHLLIWLSIVFLPLLLIVYIQVTFLPYHDVLTTWSHRAVLLVDMLVILGIGVFLRRRETRFLRALARTIRHQPVNVLLTAVFFAFLTFFSLLVATVPGEALDKLAARISGTTVARTAKAAGDLSGRSVFSLTALIFEDGGGKSAQPLLRRNLHVTDQDLVSNADDDRGEVSINLRDRDLTNAVLDRSDLHRADFTGANLEGASLAGTDLRHARLSCADIDGVLTQQVARDRDCTRLESVDLSRALLSGADLRLALVSDARFEGASLDDADLRYSDLTGADFSGAQMQRASLSGGATLIGANFLGAAMQGADLTGAKLYAADFFGAQLQGAQLSFIQAMGANFEGANLDAALVNFAKLQGADFSNASLVGADLTNAVVWLADAPETSKTVSADLASMKIRPPEVAELDAIGAAIDGIEVRKIRERVDRSLASLKAAAESQDWLTSDAGRAWSALRASSDTTSLAYRQELTEFLSGYACLAKFADGSVATGIVRRALATNFRGDVMTLNRRLTAAACLGGKIVTADLMLKLAAAAEAAAMLETNVTSSTSVPEP
ncbi:MAG: pentapeptide repeat-containing protein [Hyphomicrobiaceae bacterium]